MKKTQPETHIRNQVRDVLRFDGWFVFYIMQGMGSFRRLVRCQGRAHGLDRSQDSGRTAVGLSEGFSTDAGGARWRVSRGATG